MYTFFRFRDILVIRDIVRMNFLMYYAQENLMDLKSRQNEEERKMNETEANVKVCDFYNMFCAENT